MTHEEGSLLAKKTLAGEITEAQFVEELKKTTPDMAVDLIKVYGFEKSKGNIGKFFREFTNDYPDFVQFLKDNIVLTRKADSGV